MSRRFVLPPMIRQRIIDHALAERPLECVGLLAGKGDVAERIYPLANEAKSSTRFFAAEGLFVPMREMRNASLDLVAIYHSHPNSPPRPSRRDMDENQYPDAIHVIVSLVDDQPTMKAWLLASDDAEEVDIVDSAAFIA